jgi:linoleate 10R-lipoxygenase
LQVAASNDPARFPEPDQVKLDRPLDDYINYGTGPHVSVFSASNLHVLNAI